MPEWMTGEWTARLPKLFLSDLVDSREDARRIRDGAGAADGHLDPALSRHPIALGLIGRRQALPWMTGWALVAGVGSFLLNPVCRVILSGG